MGSPNVLTVSLLAGRWAVTLNERCMSAFPEESQAVTAAIGVASATKGAKVVGYTEDGWEYDIWPTSIGHDGAAPR